MPTGCDWISNAMPASYALEALQQVSAHTGLTATAVRDIVVVLGFALACPVPGRRDAAAADPRDATNAGSSGPGGPPEIPTPAIESWPVRENCLRVNGIDRTSIRAVASGGRRRRRAGAPLLRHQAAVVRRGDPYSDRPDGR